METSTALEEARQALKTKEKMELVSKIDVELMKSFGIDPSKYDADTLITLTSHCIQAVRDGRLTVTIPISYRIHAEYYVLMDAIKVLYPEMSFAKLMGAVLESVANGDIVLDKMKHDPMNRRIYGPLRVLLKTRDGRIINNTVRKGRPHGTRF